MHLRSPTELIAQFLAEMACIARSLALGCAETMPILGTANAGTLYHSNKSVRAQLSKVETMDD